MTEIENSVLTFEEWDGLTVHGEAFHAQVRTRKLAFMTSGDAPRDVDGAPLLGMGDVAKLHALLNAADQRKAW